MGCLVGTIGRTDKTWLEQLVEKAGNKACDLCCNSPANQEWVRNMPSTQNDLTNTERSLCKVKVPNFVSLGLKLFFSTQIRWLEKLLEYHSGVAIQMDSSVKNKLTDAVNIQ